MTGQPQAAAEQGSALASYIRSAGFVSLVASAVLLPVLTGAAGTAFRLLALAVGMVGAFFWLLAMIFERRVVLPRGLLAAAGFVAVLAGVVSAFLSDCPQAAILTLLTWLGYGSGFLLAFWISSNEAARRLAVRALCAVAVPIAVYGVLQYAVILDLTREQIEADPAAALRQTGMTEQDYAALLRRTTSKRVFSTFALPNSLAGYLLCVIPPTVGLFVLSRRPAARVALGGAIVLLLTGLFLTFSKGGWLAGFIVLVVFAATHGFGWLRRHWTIALLVAAALGTVLGGALLYSPTLRVRMREMSRELGGSARVRAQYWAAGVSMWRSRPVFGVGPGNFANHYPAHKAVAAEEVKCAHNDYVQLLAECGPLVMAGYIVFWLMALRTLSSRRSGSESAEGICPPGQADALASSGAVSIAALVAIGSDLVFARALNISGQTLVHVVAVCGFAALWWLAFRASDEAMSVPYADRVLRRALAFGLLGFALHSLVDLNLYVEGVGYTAFVAAGFAVGGAHRREFELRGARQIGALVACSVAALAVLWGVSRVCEADSYRQLGVHLMRREAAADANQIRTALENSCRLNPLDHQSHAALGSLLAHLFETGWDHKHLAAAIDAWKRATELNPSFPEYHAHLAALFRTAARLRPAFLSDYLDEYGARAEQLALPSPVSRFWLPAMVEAFLATRQAPTKPQLRLLYGEVLQLGGLRTEAHEQYRIALRLHEEMVAGRAPQRQWLAAGEIHSAKSKLGLTPSGDGAIIPK